MDFRSVIEAVGVVIEGAGVAVIVVGLGVSSVTAVLRGLRGGEHGYRRYRRDLGRSILLGLEFLIAADIIGTVAIEPTLENVGVLALIVLVRTFLSMALELEINGRWPWQKSTSTDVGD